MLSLPPALQMLARWPQFVCWFAAPSERQPGKFDKLPVAWTSGLGARADGRPVGAGEPVNAHDPQFWTTAENALAHAAKYDRGHGFGVGFAITHADPFFFLDIDGAYDRASGQWSALATDLCRLFHGAAIEVSQSGTGLHILGCVSPGFPQHRKKNIPLHLELYTADRFVALTGTNAVGDVWTDHSRAFGELVTGLFQPVAHEGFEGWTSAPVPEWAGPEDDDALLARMMRSTVRMTAAAAFDGASQPPTFAQLFNADEDALGAYWPHPSQPFDRSSADQGLANHLAYFTGKDCARMERLMRRSALHREKWDDRPEYLQATVVGSCRFIKSVLNEPKREAALPAHATSSPRMGRRSGAEFMSPEDQTEYFAGCVYVGSINQVFDTSSGRTLSKSAFDVLKGGYLFVMDALGKKTSESSFDAFTKSRVNACPYADEVCFRPEHEPGHLVDTGAVVLVNTYVPYDAPAEAGDVTPFLDFLSRLLPDAHDRDILLHYMASCVQNPGVKFHWWPVIQGAEGNGKTLLMSIMVKALGEHYCHLPNAQAMAREGLKFNSWIYRKLFIGVEEIKVGDRHEFLEEFKVVVSNDRNGMEPKGQEQVTRDNRANGFLLTNHRNAIPITVDTRRYPVFYSAQQTAGDIIRDGMGGSYFPELYAWFKSEGSRYITHYLKTFELRAELDPARLCVRAPETSSKAEAIVESRSRAENEIVEAIAQGRQGFCGGFVSSVWVDDLLDRARLRVPRTQFDNIMAALGYIPHPGLKDGRTGRAVKPDHRKPRLFVTPGHLTLELSDPGRIADAYERAQTSAASDIAFGSEPPAHVKV